MRSDRPLDYVIRWRKSLSTVTTTVILHRPLHLNCSISKPPSPYRPFINFYMPGLTHNMDSSPTLVDSPTATESFKRTNTLVLTQLPIPFFHPRVMDALRDHFALHGKIHAWAPLRTFARVIVVYESEDSADEAKVYCDGLQIDATPETYATRPHAPLYAFLTPCPALHLSSGYSGRTLPS